MKLSQIQRDMIDKKRITKTKILAFTVGAALTLTGCTFSFSKDVQDIPDVITQFSQEIDSIVTTEWDKLTKEDKNAAEEIKDAASHVGEFEKATLVRVVDGDTIVVEIGKEEVKVRLIGIDTPESVASKEYLDRTGKQNSKEGEDACEYTKALLKNVTAVYLQKDTSDTDKYGRLLRYVWLEIPKDDTDLTEIAEKMLNGILVKAHVANVATYEPDTSHADDFEEISNME